MQKKKKKSMHVPASQCLNLSPSVSISFLPLMSLSAHHSQIMFNNAWLLGINVNAKLHRVFMFSN